MITDELRVLPCNPRGVEIAKAYLYTIEMGDLAGLKRLMKPDVRLTHANYPPVQGRDGAANLIEGYRQIVDSIEFDVHTIVGSEDLVVIEKVNVATLNGGALARVPTVTILEFTADGLIRSIRIYTDVAELYRKLETRRAARTSP